MVQYGRGPTVFRTSRNGSGNGGDLHLDGDCDRLSSAKPENILEKPLLSFPDWVDRCSECFDISENELDLIKEEALGL